MNIFPALTRKIRRAVTVTGEVAQFAARRVAEDRLAQVAGSLTFTTTLSLVPLVTIVFALLTALPVFDHMRDALRDLLVRNLMPVSISDSIFRYLNLFASKARGLTVIGLISLAITSISTMLTIDSALNTIWHVRRPRPLAQRIIVYWTLLTIGPLLLAGSVAVSSYLSSVSAELITRPILLVRVLLSLLSPALLLLAYALLYIHVPNRAVARHDALIGAIVATTAFEATRAGFSYYIAQFPSYTAIYGALAALPLFLLWLYSIWLITLIGATVAACLPALRGRYWNRGHAPGEAFADALRILRALHLCRQSAAPGQLPGLRAEEIRSAARLGWDEVENLLEPLEADGLILRTQPISNKGSKSAAGEEIWILAADTRLIPLARLFQLFAWNPELAVRAGFDEDDPMNAVVRATVLANGSITLDQVLNGTNGSEQTVGAP